MIYDNLKDILKHTHSMSFLENVKLRGEDGITYVDSIADDRSVVLFGRLTRKIEEIDGSTVGLARMGILAGCVNFPAFKEAGADILVLKTTRDGNEVPTELEFRSKEGHTANYRFMGEQAVEEQCKMPKLKEPEYDIVYAPTKKNLIDLAYFSQMLSSYEPTFGVVLKNGKLQLSVGSSGGDRSLVPFAEGIEGSFNGSWRWPLAQVLSILKLCDGEDIVMNFASAGLLKISVDSGLGNYQYMLSARS